MRKNAPIHIMTPQKLCYSDSGGSQGRVRRVWWSTRCQDSPNRTTSILWLRGHPPDRCKSRISQCSSLWTSTIPPPSSCTRYGTEGTPRVPHYPLKPSGSCSSAACSMLISTSVTVPAAHSTPVTAESSTEFSTEQTTRSPTANRLALDLICGKQ